MPEIDADAEPDTGHSHRGDTISKVDEEVIVTSTRKVIAILTVNRAKRQELNEIHAS